MGCTALFCACWYGYVDIARLLLDHGAAIDCQNLVIVSVTDCFYGNSSKCARLHVQEGISPLYLTSHEGHFQLVQVLIEYGASVNITNEVSFCTHSVK